MNTISALHGPGRPLAKPGLNVNGPGLASTLTSLSYYLRGTEL